MEAAAMKAFVLLAFIGSSLGALIPTSPGFYSNFISQRGQLQPLDGTPLDIYHPQQYITYNVPQVNTAVRTIPTAIFANGRPTIAHIPTTYNYYGTPIYDFRFPFRPISPPGSIPLNPNDIPRPAGIPPRPSVKPENDDGIEKLDEKIEPEHDPLGEAAGAANSEENDTVSVEAAT